MRGKSWETNPPINPSTALFEPWEAACDEATEVAYRAQLTGPIPEAVELKRVGGRKTEKLARSAMQRKSGKAHDDARPYT